MCFHADSSAYVQRENDELKSKLQRKELHIEQINAEMQRRCTAFDCQLQSACSECTAAVEEHVTASLVSLRKRVDNAQRDIDRFVGQRAQATPSKFGFESPCHDKEQKSHNAPHDDIEPSTLSGEHVRGHVHTIEKRSIGDSESLTRSLSVRHDDSVQLLS